MPRRILRSVKNERTASVVIAESYREPTERRNKAIAPYELGRCRNAWMMPNWSVFCFGTT
jgi:hypothetical protein